MSNEVLRKYIDIINDHEKLNEDILEEGMLQKLAGLALGGVLALGPKVGQADTIYSYLPSQGITMRVAFDQQSIPADAKVVLAVDTDTKEVSVLKGGVKGQQIQPDPNAIKQAQQPQQAQAQQPQQAQQPTAQADQENIGNWEVSKHKTGLNDKGKIVYELESSNSVNLGSPYGTTKMKLYVRTLDDGTLDPNGAIFIASKGQFYPGRGAESFNYKIDGNNPSYWYYSKPSDGSSGFAWIDNSEKFYEQIKNGKSLKIEIGYFQRGNEIFEFDLSGIEKIVAKNKKKGFWDIVGTN